jgi:ubiquitin carboxyl-terminal hydrolase 1
VSLLLLFGNGNKSFFFFDFQNACITKEYFRGENKYRCDTCRGYTEAIRTTSFELLPRLLIIQLKRFSGGMEKINSFIPTPLTLHCFCKHCCLLPENEKKHIYKLYSVITHVGATMSVGHYIAYTCSLDILNEYKHCPKEKFKAEQLVAAAKLSELNGQAVVAAAGEFFFRKIKNLFK